MTQGVLSKCESASLNRNLRIKLLADKISRDFTDRAKVAGTANRQVEQSV